MSIGSALFGPAQALVLAKLFDQPLRAYHVNELMRATGLGSASLQRELKRLETGGLILSEQIGNLRRVRANERSPLFGELAAIVRKTLGTDAVLREALRSVDRRIVFALVYGSVAAGSDRINIDPMIVGDDVGLGEVMPALLDAEARLGRRISPTCYTSASFERMRADPQSFVSQVLRSPTRVLMGEIGEPVAT
jgi:DNA-binding MarR family transcriptional regulator